MEKDYQTFDDYLIALERKWIRVILTLGFTLVPLFGLLDVVMMPGEKLHLFWALRGAVTVACIIQFILISRFPPQTKSVVYHAYWFTFIVGGMISYMTVHLGGFEAPYYAGLNLVIIAVGLFLPWRASQGTINGLIIAVQYVAINLLTDPDWQFQSLINNLYFMGATIVIAVTISHHKHILTRNEFDARTALWGEMEIAKKIQTALLPGQTQIAGYEIAAIMQPADEVGGDYYDIIPQNDHHDGWVCVGDVSGHGVTAGLIMMMTQTSVQSILKREPNISPSDMLLQVNGVLKENISRLKETKYLTIYALKLLEDRVVVAGKHQDLLIYRQATGEVEIIKTHGFWLGIEENIARAFRDQEIQLASGDVVCLFTDGITELAEQEGAMFGRQRLIELFKRTMKSESIDLAIPRFMQTFAAYCHSPDDDITLVLIKKK